MGRDHALAALRRADAVLARLIDARPDRLTELAKTDGGHVLASAATLGGAQGTEALSWDLGELVKLRGRAAPTRLARPAAPPRAIQTVTLSAIIAEAV